MQQAKGQGLLVGNKREKLSQPREVGTRGGKWRKWGQAREVKTHSVVLRAGLLSAKTHEG